MATLILDLPPDLDARLRTEAERQGKPVHTVVQEWLVGHLPPPAPVHPNDRDRSTEALRAAGLLAEPSPLMKQLAAEATMTLDEVSAALERAEGKPLSEIILEQRGPRG